jgi:hypothetical protein
VLPAIPRPEVVSSTFRSLAKHLEKVQRRINAEAAKEMRAGQYTAAQRWMEVGQSLADFAQRVHAYSQEWQTLVRTTRIAGRSDKPPATLRGAATGAPRRTPAWRLCLPALRAVEAHSGKIAMEDLVTDLSRDLAPQLEPRDLQVLPKKGMPRWQVALSQAYRHCQREGWIEKRRDGLWQLTALGRDVVARDQLG